MQTNTVSAQWFCLPKCRCQPTRHSLPGPNAARNADLRLAEGLVSRLQKLSCTFLAPVQVVTVEHEEDYALVLQRKWPRLSMVISQDKRASVANIEQYPSDFRICVLEVATMGNKWAAEGNKQATISMLRPLHSLATDLSCTQSAAQQLAHQMKIRWPLMSKFAMSYVPEGLDLDIVSQLVKGSWKHLRDVSLSVCDLKAEALLLLSQGNWPRLISLDVAGNWLDAEGMASLAKGNWPKLTTLILSFDPTQGALAIAQLSTANWPIVNLVIVDTPFNVDMAAELANLQLPKLMSLYLTQADLTAAAVSKLARADWPLLGNLTFDHVDLDAVGVLLELDLCKLQELKSDGRGRAGGFQQRSVVGPDVGLWADLVMIRMSKHLVELALVL